jgi:plastocyanin
MRKWYVLPAALTCAAVAASVAFASGHAAAGSATVKALSGEKVAINQYLQDNMRFSPGTISVKSGSLLTFEYGDREQEPHTLTIVPKSSLPKTADQVMNCGICQKLATGHLKNPKAPPDQSNPIVHWTLNKGHPGLDTAGDSVAIQPDPKHKSISVKVSAKPGTTLYFLCAVHPWMQGKIVVK